MTDLAKKSTRRRVLGNVRRLIEESGLFTKKGIDRYMSMLGEIDDMMDIELSTMFLIRDGMQNHSYEKVRGFVNRFPLQKLSAALQVS